MAEVATQETFSTGVIVERLVAIREERRRLKRLDSELSQSWRDLEALLINQMDAQGVTKASTDAGTATVSETGLHKVEDWDGLYAHPVFFISLISKIPVFDHIDRWVMGEVEMNRRHRNIVFAHHHAVGPFFDFIEPHLTRHPIIGIVSRVHPFIKRFNHP